jgi:hypothetical protein
MMRRATLVISMLYATAGPAAAAPLVTSDSDCPSAAAVQARLLGLWSADRPDSVAAHIRVENAQMLVELVGSNEPAITRSLPADAECASRAQAAALVIAAWLDTMTDPLGLPVPVPARPSDRPVRTKPREAPLPGPRLLLAVGAFASLDPQGAGAVLSGEAAWSQLIGRFGLQAGFSFPLPRELAVGQGLSKWWRPVLALQLRVPLTEGTWALEAGAGPALGLLVVAGNGFDQNHTDVATSWGAITGFRLAHRRGRAGAVWAELRALAWPAAQHIRAEVMGASPRLAALPRIEGQLGLGFSFSVF